MSRTKNFFFSLLPAIIALGVNVIVSLAGTITAIISAVTSGKSILDALQSLLNGDGLAELSIIYAIIVIIIMGIWYYKKCYFHSSAPISRNEIPRRAIGLLLLGIGLFYFISYILLSVQLLSPDWFASYDELMGRMNLDESIIMWVYSLLFAPVCEELVFRGVTMHYASRTMTFWGMNIFQAVLFGVFHGNIVQGLYAFVLGLILGYIRYYGGLHYCIAFHIFFNFMNIPASLISGWIGDIPTAFYLLIIGISLVMLIIGFCIFHATTHGPAMRPFKYYPPRNDYDR